jgi:cell division protein FtsI/penicillin-binding protein 2
MTEDKNKKITTERGEMKNENSNISFDFFIFSFFYIFAFLLFLKQCFNQQYAKTKQ